MSGPALRPGMEMVIAGMADAGNNGTFHSDWRQTPEASPSAKATGVTASSQSGTGAVVVEISTAFPTGCDVNGLGNPGGVLGGVRFRVSSAASADSTKVMVGKCDAGSTTVIRTSDDTPVLDMPAPLGHLHSTQRRKRLAAESSVRDGGTVGRTPDVGPRTSGLADALSTLSSRAKSRDLLSAGTALPCAETAGRIPCSKADLSTAGTDSQASLFPPLKMTLFVEGSKPRHTSREEFEVWKSEVRSPTSATRPRLPPARSDNSTL